MAFSTFPVLFNHHPYHFHHPKENLILIKQSLSIPPSPLHALKTVHLLPISVDLPRLDILYKWNPTVYVLLCLASFTQYNIYG